MRAAAAMIALLLPAPVMAWDASLCLQSIMGEDYRIVVSGVSDLGQGLVLELNSGTDGTTGSDQMSFQHCASGEVVTAVSVAFDADERVLVPVNPRDIMVAAMQSATASSMPEIVAQMTEAGIDARHHITARETCGCAVFYPAARGDKAAWAP